MAMMELWNEIQAGLFVDTFIEMYMQYLCLWHRCIRTCTCMLVYVYK